MKTAGASTSTSKDQDQLPTINTETERIKANQSSSITNHQSRMVINFPFSLQPLNDPPYPLLNHPNPNNIIHDNPKLVNHHPIVDRAPVNHTFIVPANHTLSSSTSSHESTASKQPLATANHPLPFSDHILTPANQSLTTANNPLSTTAVGNGNNQYAIVDYNHTNVHDHKDNDQKPASGICGECDIAYANHPTVQKSMQGDTAMVISYDDEDEYDHDYEDDDDDDSDSWLSVCANPKPSAFLASVASCTLLLLLQTLVNKPSHILCHNAPLQCLPLLWFSSSRPSLSISLLS